jgi:lipopolysaccharide transport system permease protein
MNLFSIIPIIAAYILLILFTTGVSLLTSALNVRFRDVQFFVQALLVIWFYATPIVYSFAIIPHAYIWFWRINPMTSILQLFQYGFIAYSPPGPAMLTINIAMILVVFVLGVRVFRKESKNFDDWI